MSVMDRLIALFSAPPAKAEIEPLPETDVPHALGALLVRVALSDAAYAVEEISRIDRVLAKFQNIGPIEAAKLRAECERLESYATNTSDFALYLCLSVGYEERLNMVEALWQVAFADGKLAEIEKEVMELTQNQLGVRAEDCDRARAKALASADLPFRR